MGYCQYTQRDHSSLSYHTIWRYFYIYVLYLNASLCNRDYYIMTFFHILNLEWGQTMGEPNNHTFKVLIILTLAFDSKVILEIQNLCCPLYTCIGESLLV